MSVYRHKQKDDKLESERKKTHDVIVIKFYNINM